MRKISTHKNADKCQIDPAKDVEFTLLQNLLPSRRKWAKLNKHERKDLYKDNLIRNEVRIYKTYKREDSRFRKGEDVERWYKDLIKFCDKVRNQIEEIHVNKYAIQNPTINGIKKKVKNGVTIYRPIAVYGIEDRIITSLVSKYLITTFDSYFFDCSYAFRSAKDGEEVRNHHDTISQIFKYKKRNKRVWVSECDIEKFFDSVNHEHILKVLDDFILKLESDGVKIDKKARNIFVSYLKSFAFNKDVYPLNHNEEWFKDNNLAVGIFEWVEKKLVQKHGANYVSNKRIGVPQGNAISCLIANLIMHNVDKNVLEVDENIFYIRFCDDMIIMHPDKTICNSALNIYKESIEENYLIYHRPKKILNYRIPKNARDFWDLKSKEPFFWGHKHAGEENVPWVAFVGYQIRYDGKIRVRKDSLKKEIKKQGKEINRIHKALGKTGKDMSDYSKYNRWSKRKMLKSAEERLIAMSVGKVTMYNHRNANNNGLCWTNGFKKMDNNPIIKAQMRLLDRMRKRRVARLRKALPSDLKAKKKDKRKKLKQEDVIYFGGAFSYYNFIKYKKEDTGKS